MTGRRAAWLAGAAAVAAGAAIAVMIALTRGGGPGAPSTTTTTTRAPGTPAVPAWGAFPGAPPALAAPPGGSATVTGRTLTVRRADGTVLARATLDARGRARDARYFDRRERLTIVVAGLRVARGALAGGARVTCGSAASAPDPFRWTRMPVRWRVSGAPPPGVPRAAALAALRRARATWNGNRSHCRFIPDHSRARFAFAGSTTRGVGRDGVNVVEYGAVDRLGGVCVGTVACTITWVAGSRAVESDTRIDRRHRGGFTATRPRPGSLDLASVLVHESGHTLGFDHVLARSVVMFPVIAPGSTAGRLLGRGDALANNRKYPLR